MRRSLNSPGALISEGFRAVLRMRVCNAGSEPIRTLLAKYRLHTWKVPIADSKLYRLYGEIYDLCFGIICGIY